MSMLGCTATGPSDAARTLVFLHGGGGSRWHWQPVADRLRHHWPVPFRALFPDLPGHGESPGPFDLESAAARLAELFATEGVERATLIGFSLGADLALELAALRPDLVEAVATTGAVVRKMRGARLIGALTAGVLPAFRWRPLADLQARYSGVPEEFRDQWYRDTVQLSPATTRTVYAESLGGGWPRGLERFSGDVLILAGEKEAGVVATSMDQLMAILPHARGYTVTGANHTWPLSQPDRMASALAAWLEGRPLPAGFVEHRVGDRARPHHFGGGGHLYEVAMAPLEAAGFAARRRRLIGRARGRVAEIGPGMGANLGLYRGPADGGAVTHVDLLEPEGARRLDLLNRAARTRVPMEVHTVGAEGPFPDPPYDTIVSTLVMCSIPHLEVALPALRRALAPGGQLLFMEHEGSAGWRGHLQDAADPVWSRVSGGCHLNRDLVGALRQHGWTPIEAERFNFPLPVLFAKHCVMGVAVPTVRPGS